MSWVREHDQYLRDAREICPYCILTTKDHWFWTLASYVVLVLSCGRMKRDKFLHDFASTLGPVQAYPREWESISPLLLAHESRHIQQFQFAGWFVPILGWLHPQLRVWVGILPMIVVYGLFPLPIFFAWGRFRLELDADSTAWRALLKSGEYGPEDVRERAIWFARTVSGWSYIRPWPTSWTERAFLSKAEQVIEQWEEASGSA